MTSTRHHSLLGKKSAVLLGYSTTPADNVANGSTPITIVPPAGMLAGDLVYCTIFNASAGPVSASVATTGGQTWTTTKDRSGSLPEIWTSWCTFNGTWSANPVWSIGSNGPCKSVQMLVFRPTKSGAVWAVDQPSTSVSSTAVNPATVPSVTNTQNNVLTIGRIITSPVTTLYQSHTGLFTWVPQNFRNSGTNNKNSLLFYNFQKVPGATGNLVITMDSSGTTFYSTQSFYYT